MGLFDVCLEPWHQLHRPAFGALADLATWPIDDLINSCSSKRSWRLTYLARLTAEAILIDKKSLSLRARVTGSIEPLNCFVSTLLTVSSSGDDYLHCESIMRNWVDSSMETEVHTDELILKDLLFFLHVPRTGGRTYFHCLLRKLYTSPQKCPLSYDKLRFDPR
ncbi:hypothetical protein ZIOFF_052509 [Zingiber officinale]|uniref:Uncharacterized protein n=1 Tax=Zingiber officinale TaxID=94328 RepID=A0A8J5KNI3_ZINOF|nr:hypothetical protein ZIOFF_052509 [Zingiber officinale]